MLSFSKMGRSRLSDKEVLSALTAFNAENFEEDNHESSVAQKYFLAVEGRFRAPCPFKDEVIINEA
jgi:hypothetical protein